jgi:histidine phosphotransferase ChpT
VAGKIERSVADPGDAVRLAELLAIRLCHDISGPLGTLMGSVELATEDPESAAEALSLASDVSTALVQRLRLLRTAWGGATGPLDMAAFRAMAAQLPGRRPEFELAVPDETACFSPAGARLALNVLMLAQESLPLGGIVAFSGDPQGDMLVTISGPRVAWPAGFAAYVATEARAWEALRAAPEPSAARGLQALLTALIAHSSGLRLSFLMAGPTDAPPLLMSLGGA